MIETIGRVAESAMGHLKNEPLSLALILLNIIFLGVGYLILAKISDRSAAEVLRADELIAMLAQCPR